MRYCWTNCLMALIVLSPMITHAATTPLKATELASHMLAQSPDYRVWQTIRHQKERDVAHAYIPLNPEWRVGMTHSNGNAQPAWSTDIEWAQPLMISNRPQWLTQDAVAQLALTNHHLRLAQIDRYAQLLQAIVSYEIQRQAWQTLTQHMLPFKRLLTYANARPQRSPQEQVDVALLMAFFNDLSYALQQRHIAMMDAKWAIQEWGPFDGQGPIHIPPLPPTLSPIQWATTPQAAVFTHQYHQLDAALHKWAAFNEPNVAVNIKGSVPLSSYNGGGTVGIGLVVVPSFHHQTKGAWATTQVARDGLGHQEQAAQQAFIAQHHAVSHAYESAMAQLSPANEAHRHMLKRSLDQAMTGLQRGLVTAVSVVELGRLILQHEARHTQALTDAHHAHIEWGRWMGKGAP